MADMDSFFDKQDKKEKKKEKKDKKKKGDDDLDAVLAAELGVGGGGGLGIDPDELAKKEKKDKKDKKEKKAKKEGDDIAVGESENASPEGSPAASPSMTKPKANKIWSGAAPTETEAPKKEVAEPEDSKPKAYKAPSRGNTKEPKVDQAAFSTGLDDLLDADGGKKALPPSTSASPAGSPNVSGPGAFKPNTGGSSNVYRPAGASGDSAPGNPNVYRPTRSSHHDSPEPSSGGSSNPNVFDPRSYRSEREKQKEAREAQMNSKASPSGSPNSSSAPGAYRPGQFGGGGGRREERPAPMDSSIPPVSALPTSGGGYKPGAFKATGVVAPKQKELTPPPQAVPAPQVEKAEAPKLATSSGGYKPNTSGSSGAFKAGAAPKKESVDAPTETPAPTANALPASGGGYKPGAFKSGSGGAAASGNSTPPPSGGSSNPNAYKPGMFAKKN